MSYYRRLQRLKLSRAINGMLVIILATLIGITAFALHVEVFPHQQILNVKILATLLLVLWGSCVMLFVKSCVDIGELRYTKIRGLHGPR